MTDLGHLLSSVEDNVERAHAGATTSADVLDRTRSTVRRRRVLRHTRDGAAGALAVVLVAGLATWGLQGRGTAPADVAPTTTAAPSASAAPRPSGVALTLGAPVQVATPRDAPVADLLAASGPGWALAAVKQERVGAPTSVDPADFRTTIALVSPDGERTPLLDVPGNELVHLADWVPGSTLAVAGTFVGDDDRMSSGLLDLRTGTFTSLPFEWEHHPLGVAVTGESAWLDVAMTDETRDALLLHPDAATPVAPGTRVALDPETWVAVDGGDVSAVPPVSGLLRLVSPDGVARDLGEVALPHRVHPLSPDRAWLALQAPDGGLLGLDLRTGESHPVAGAPTDGSCRYVGWADQHAVLAQCLEGDGLHRLTALDLAAAAGAPRVVGLVHEPVRDAWPLGDGRVALGRVVVPAPCDVTSDPALLVDGELRPLTDDWSPYDHGTDLTFAAGAFWTHLNGCYPGSGRADPQRDVRVDPSTGAVTTLGWLEAHRDGQVVVDGEWRVTGVDVVTAR